MIGSLREEVLELLLRRKGEPVSGESLADNFGVTRAAVWKAIEALRQEGYEVKSLPGRGYGLHAPKNTLRQAEVAALLSGGRFGGRCRVFDEIDSTNREAARWAETGGEEGSLVAAKFQTAGRGRLGRAWFGGEGSTLMFSLILRPKTPVAEVSKITYAAALALAETLSLWVKEEALEIKWPNDVLINGRKAAGILLESRLEGGAVDYVVLGVGINVKGSRADMPPEITRTAAILEEEATGYAPGVLEVLDAFLGKFEEAYGIFLHGGFEALKPRWDRWFRMAGKLVNVYGGGTVLTGRVNEMGGDGSLVILTDQGPRTVHAGDVEWATTKEPDGGKV